MSIDTLIMLLGVLTVMLPYLGFPSSWDRLLYVLIGLGVITLGVVVRRRSGGHKPSGQEFVDSVPPEAKGFDHHEASTT